MDRARRPLFVALALAGAALATACTPRYDWREIHGDDLPMWLSLPSRPASMSRSINLDGIPVTMHMRGARVEDETWTAAWAVLDTTGLDGDARSALRRKGLDAMRKGMLANIAGERIETSDDPLVLADAGGARVGLLAATAVHAFGSVGGKSIEMHARFASIGDRLHQFVVISAAPDATRLASFFDSVRVRVWREGEFKPEPDPEGSAAPATVKGIGQ